MKILSYNTNGIRSALNKGLLDFIEKGQFDIVCIQETKAHMEQVDTEGFDKLGYHHFWHSAEKKGYSGVAIFSKIKPDNVTIALKCLDMIAKDASLGLISVIGHCSIVISHRVQVAMNDKV